MSVNEINEIQINVKKSKNSYHQNLSTVLQFSSVQFTECQYKVKTILQLQQLVMRLMSRSTWCYKNYRWAVTFSTNFNFPHFHVSYFHVSLFPYLYFHATQYGAAFSCLVFSCHALWCRIFISRIFTTCIFDGAEFSFLAFSVTPRQSPVLRPNSTVSVCRAFAGQQVAQYAIQRSAMVYVVDLL